MKEIHTNKEISVINSIQVPAGYEQTAIEVRNIYIEYFKTKPGFVSATFYKSIHPDTTFNYVNIVVWESYDSFENVVNEGFENVEGLNKDGYKVLGKGFPAPILVNPGQFQIISIDERLARGKNKSE